MIPKLSKHFRSTAELQFYQLVPSLADLVTYLEQSICPRVGGGSCSAKAAAIASAAYVDIDFDTISQVLNVNAFGYSPSEKHVWDEQVWNTTETSRIEVGVLASEKPMDPEPEVLSLGGFLTVLGEDDSTSQYHASTTLPLFQHSNR